MSVIQRVAKRTTRKGKKVLLSREPQAVESAKQTLFFRGRKTSELIRSLLKDLFVMKKPHAKMLSKKNDISIFESAVTVEELCRKNDTPLFVLGSHSKKRPDNLVLGRMFDYALLDMIELAVISYNGLKEFDGSKIALGTKPCLIFSGLAWEETEDLKHLKSIFIDLFHREHVEFVTLQGLEHAITFTANNGKILLRSYKVFLKKSGCKTPRIEIEEIGPRIDFRIRRSKLSTVDLMKQACRKPKEIKKITKKNISADGLGKTHGLMHVPSQNIKTIQTRKLKGLRKTLEEKKLRLASKTDVEDVQQFSVKKIKLN